MASYKRRKRSRGRIEQLPSGSLRVVVYAGSDPLTGRRHFLREVVPAGPDAAAEAEKAVRRLAAEVDERRHPTKNASLDKSATVAIRAARRRASAADPRRRLHGR